MVGAIAVVILFVLVVWACCSSDSGSGDNQPCRNVSTQRRNTGGYCTYSECPSCGAPHYDGYCEECGYPDINQGWIGENY